MDGELTMTKRERKNCLTPIAEDRTAKNLHRSFIGLGSGILRCPEIIPQTVK